MPDRSRTTFSPRLPKTDLHVHLDGSLRIPTLIELARAAQVELPSYTEGGLRETVYKERYDQPRRLPEGLQVHGRGDADAEALERIAAELAEDNQAEGVRYLEVRFAPQLHVRPGLDAVQVIAAVDRGLRRARDAFNRQRGDCRGHASRPSSTASSAARCACSAADSASYYDTLLAAHPYTRPKNLFAMASLDLARAAVLARDTLGCQVVGFDLAGEESGYPASAHKRGFRATRTSTS